MVIVTVKRSQICVITIFWNDDKMFNNGDETIVAVK